MRDIIYAELRECNRTIRQMPDGDETTAGYEMVRKTIETLCRLSTIARKEGLLSLEEAALDLDDLQNGKYLYQMILLVVDGTDPELVESLCTGKLFALCLEGFEALQFILMMVGVCAIENYANPRIIQELLLSILPEKLEEEYRKSLETRSETHLTDNETEDEIPESFFEAGIVVKPSDEQYFLMRIADYALKELDDAGMQRLLRDVDNRDLAMAMKGLSGPCRRKICTNLSKRLAGMIYGDMKHMGAVLLKDAALAAERILLILMKLMSAGELVAPDAKALQVFCDIFEMEKQEQASPRAVQAKSELEIILQEYASRERRVISEDC